MKSISRAKSILVVLTLSVSACVAVCLGADNVGDALRLKAMDGDVKAMKELGDYYLGEYHTEDGKRLAVKKNRTEAAKWYRKAASKGDVDAMFRLVKNDQLPVEREERLQWLERMGAAANQFKVEEKLKAYGNIVEAYLNLKDSENAYDWMFKLCDLGTSVTKDWRGFNPAFSACLLRGRFLPMWEKVMEKKNSLEKDCYFLVDFPAHVKFLRYAIEKDLPCSGHYDDNVLLRVLMGEAYEKGFGVAQDLEEAYKWYVDAVDYAKSHTCKRSHCIGYAQRRLGECLRYGKGCERNLKEAVKWYEKAAFNKDLEARNQFAEWCLTGLADGGWCELTVRQAAMSHAFLSTIAEENVPADEVIIEPDVNRAEELSDVSVYNYDDQAVIAAYRLCRIYKARKDWGKVVKLLKDWHDRSPNPFKAKMKYWLASAYQLGRGGVAVDKAKGNKLLKEAAQHGDPTAMEVLDRQGIEYNVKRGE